MSKTLQQEAEECRKALEEFIRVCIKELKKDVMRILCWLGFHKWSSIYFLHYSSYPKKYCKRCGAVRNRD